MGTLLTRHNARPPGHASHALARPCDACPGVMSQELSSTPPLGQVDVYLYGRLSENIPARISRRPRPKTRQPLESGEFITRKRRATARRMSTADANAQVSGCSPWICCEGKASCEGKAKRRML